MKRNALLLVVTMLLFSLAACGSDYTEKLNGSWKVDISSSIDLDNDLKGMSDQEKAFAEEMFKAMLGSMIIEFDTANSKMTMKIMEQRESMAFTVKSSEDKKILISADGNDINIEFVDDNKIKMQGVGDDKVIVLIRS